MATGILSRTAGLLAGKRSHYKLLVESRPTARFENHHGYQIAYDEYGDRAGFPVFYFHDAGSSRLEAVFFHREARLHGYRLIAVDRPGVGCSDYYGMNRPHEFCRDILQLADQLDLQRFGVMSFGAGGVYAITLAHMIPHRVSFHLNLAGVPGAVFNEESAASRASSLVFELTPALVKIGVFIRHTFRQEKPEKILDRLADYLNQSDRKALSNPQIRQIFAKDQHEAMRNGARGVAQDVAMCFRKLEFKLCEIEVSTQVWQGSADQWSSRSDCEYFVARLPDAHFFRIPHRGHFFFVECMDVVFKRLRTSHSYQHKLAA